MPSGLSITSGARPVSELESMVHNEIGYATFLGWVNKPFLDYCQMQL